MEFVKVSKTIVALMLFLALPNLSAFADKKEPVRSTMLSGCILSGTGQFYNGEVDRGMVYLFVEFVSLGFILAAWGDNVSYIGPSSDRDGDDGRGRVAFYIWVANRIISAIDAGVSAKKINQQKTVSVGPIGNKGRRGIMLSLRF